MTPAPVPRPPAADPAARPGGRTETRPSTRTGNPDHYVLHRIFRSGCPGRQSGRRRHHGHPGHPGRSSRHRRRVHAGHYGLPHLRHPPILLIPPILPIRWIWADRRTHPPPSPIRARPHRPDLWVRWADPVPRTSRVTPIPAGICSAWTAGRHRSRSRRPSYPPSCHASRPAHRRNHRRNHRRTYRQNHRRNHRRTYRPTHRRCERLQIPRWKSQKDGTGLYRSWPDQAIPPRTLPRDPIAST